MERAKAVWEDVLKGLEGRLNRYNMTTWFRPVQAVSLAGDEAVLSVPNEFHRFWLKDHFLTLIEDEISRRAGVRVRVALTVAQAQGEPDRSRDGPGRARPRDAARGRLRGVRCRSRAARRGRRPGGGVGAARGPSPGEAVRPAPPVFGVTAVAASASSPASTRARNGVSEKYTFSTFVVGASNRFAHAAAFAVATSSPARAYNPLFIYGGSGLGKTHLLNAIANELMRRQAHLKVLLVSAETFTNEFIAGIQTSGIDAFRKRYRSRCDVLLLDDVQFIAGRDRTQEEFFHTFNALYDAGRQIVLTSDRTPSELQKMEVRLQTRFKAGLVADIQPPDFETRVAILKRRAESDGIVLPHDVADLLARTAHKSVRELEGALTRLHANAVFTDRPVSVELVREVLRDAIAPDDRPVGADEIQRRVADYFGVGVQEIRGRARQKRVVRPRQVAMFLTRRHARLSYPEIGSQFGGKDHSTVIAAVRRIQRELDLGRDPTLQKAIQEIEHLLEA